MCKSIISYALTVWCKRMMWSNFPFTYDPYAVINEYYHIPLLCTLESRCKLMQYCDHIFCFEFSRCISMWTFLHSNCTYGTHHTNPKMLICKSKWGETEGWAHYKWKYASSVDGTEILISMTCIRVIGIHMLKIIIGLHML